jgi:hypothetical protein
MENNNKQRLFEVMERLNPDFNSGGNNNEDQTIISDILSMDEGMGNWWNKFIHYGRKGALTSGIIIAIAFSTQAQQGNKTDDVLKTGVEMASPQVSKEVSNFMIGAILGITENYLRDGKLELGRAAGELTDHYLILRDGGTPNRLSELAQELSAGIIKTYIKSEMSEELIKKFIQDGMALRSHSQRTVGMN